HEVFKSREDRLRKQLAKASQSESQKIVYPTIEGLEAHIGDLNRQLALQSEIIKIYEATFEYPTKLKAESFEEWEQVATEGYLTAITSIEERNHAAQSAVQ